MSSATSITLGLIEEGIAARAHFQVWWTLRNLALPKYLSTMNNLDYVDFFHASNAGHYKLFLLALAKIFDRDDRVAGLRELRKALRVEGRADLARCIAKQLKPIEPMVKSIMQIRNRSLVHNEHSLSRKQVYRLNGITPNQIRIVIDVACNVINCTARELGISNTIFESNRLEAATINMLEKLRRADA